ncbi:hypothetical protein [uncultured Mediterranean phage uvMED]|nr:hypothetical protein [uncultured Mediterranean phage uvMED]|tara:strand:- start:499 stop:855 length:357 start_codon:yes stop_codon:yes gene_type:complete
MKISKSITIQNSNYKNQSYLINFKYRDEDWAIVDAHFTYDTVYIEELERLETEWDNEPMLTIVHLESKTSYHVYVEDVDVYDNHYVNADNLIDCLLTKLNDECFQHVALNVVKKEESK